MTRYIPGGVRWHEAPGSVAQCSLFQSRERGKHFPGPGMFGGSLLATAGQLILGAS